MGQWRLEIRNVTIVKIHINQDRTCADMLMRRCDFQVPFFQDILKTSKTCLGFAICTLWAARMSHTNGTFISNAKMLEMSPKLNANFYGQSCLNRQSHKKAKPESAVEITTKKDTRYTRRSSKKNLLQTEMIKLDLKIENGMRARQTQEEH